MPSSASNKEQTVDFADTQMLASNLELWKSSRIKVFFIVTATTIFIVALMTALSYLIGGLFNSRPLFLILGVLLAFPISQFIVIQRVRRFAKHQIQ